MTLISCAPDQLCFNKASLTTLWKVLKRLDFRVWTPTKQVQVAKLQFLFPINCQIQTRKVYSKKQSYMCLYCIYLARLILLGNESLQLYLSIFKSHISFNKCTIFNNAFHKVFTFFTSTYLVLLGLNQLQVNCDK